MKAGRTFFRLELKKYSKAIPAILLESFLFGLLILSFGFFAIKYVNGGQTIGKIKVGIVSMEDEKLSRLLVDFAGSMDSMEESCSFELMEESAAYKGLENGSIYAVIIIPEGMIDGIMNGQNIPATVLFSTAHSRMETEIFTELAEAGNRLLRTAQAGIYAADALCLEMEHQDWLRETEDYLNRTYLQYALNRKAVFKLMEVQATGNYSLLQYYSVALLLIFLSFAGLTMGRLSESRQTAFNKIISARGLHRVWQAFLDIMAYAVVFTVFSMVLAVLFLQFMAAKAGTGIIGARGIIGLLFVFFSMGLFIRILLGITGNETAGLGVSFFLLMVMMVCSGLFLPQAFLPSFMEKTGKYLPYRIWLEAAMKMLG